MKENTKYTDTSKCPTQQALEQYVFSEMNSLEQHSIEQHLLHCKICDDVVEGLMLLKDEKELLFATQNINKKIDAAVETKKNNNRTFLAIAAGLALLIGLTFYFSSNNQQQFATNNIATETHSQLLKQDSSSTEIAKEGTDTNQLKEGTPITLKPENNKQLASNFKSESKAITKTPNVENLASDVEYETVTGNAETPMQFDAPVAAMPKQKIDIHEDLSSTKTATDDSKLEENLDVAATSAKKSAEMKAKPETETSVKKAAAEIAKTTTTNTTTVQPVEQITSLDEIQVMETKSRKLDSFMQDYAIAESNYKSGIKYYESKDFAKGLKCFDVVLKYPKTKFFEDAQFQKAKCLIGLDKKEEAKTMLQRIVKQNGKHKQEAEQILVDSF